MPKKELGFFTDELHAYANVALNVLPFIEDEVHMETWRDAFTKRSAGYVVIPSQGSIERIHHTIDDEGVLVRPRVHQNQHVYYYDRRLEDDPTNPAAKLRFFLDLPTMVDLHIALQASGRND